MTAILPLSAVLERLYSEEGEGHHNGRKRRKRTKRGEEQDEVEEEEQ